MLPVQPAQRFDVADAVRLAASHFGLHAVATPLPSERDQNFHLRAADGQEYVLKIAGAGEARAMLECQNAAMTQVAAHAPGLSALRVLPSLSGETIVIVTEAEGCSHFVRLLTYLPGKPLAKIRPHTPELLHAIGAYLATLDQALALFDHPAAHRDFHWDLQQAGEVIRRHAGAIPDPARRALLERLWPTFATETAPRLAALRKSVIHNDGNDYNVIVRPAQINTPAQIVGIIDFGDMVYSYTVAEVAVACAYAMLGKRDPLTAAAQVVAGYHRINPLNEEELAVLYPLIQMRLCISVCLAAHQQTVEPDNAYLTISEGPAWALLEALTAIHPRLAHYTLRHACGLPPCPQTAQVVAWLTAHHQTFGRVVDVDLATELIALVDLSVSSPLVAATAGLTTAEISAHIFAQIGRSGAQIGIGRYDEARMVYTGAQFGAVSEELPETRTVHLGVDLFLPAGAPVYAPLAGTVHAFANNTTHHDYGPVLILEHHADDMPFYTLYGHLSAASLAGLRVGQPITRGQPIGGIGDFPGNGDWPPHLHFQIITDLLDADTDFHGVAPPSGRAIWRSLSPDPALILRLPAALSGPSGRDRAALLAARRQHVGRSLSLSYRQPLKIVRGAGQFLYDDEGRAYLDGVNNVCHVGHCHPRVVQAGAAQMAVLNTNTRYLHDHLVDYAERLTATLPEPLRVCFFVNSGSEANDLALRLARTYTHQRDMIVINVAYHGHLTSLIEISPYKHDGPGGGGTPTHVHKVVMPDPYRGPYQGAATGPRYAAHVAEAVARIEQQGRGVAAFIAESLLGCGGQIVLPAGYLAEAYRHVRAAGGLCIADEVQVGFGRVGTHFWGFETQGVVPDIVTLGKPIGNGHPLAAVVTTPAIADAFANGMEYFNTFGGNPVSCAIGLAVLDVIRDEGLQAHALQVGNWLMEGLRGLAERSPLIGDVRGLALFIGVELVLDRGTKTPAGEHAAYIANRLRDHGILISTDGPDHNVLKLKPPLVFTAADAERLVATLEQVLNEDALWSYVGNKGEKK
jgi:4-aminobutyrate aminotransferase-like enzyme/Ser/Thr protein kinase RdoA (MazF antagonist)